MPKKSKKVPSLDTSDISKTVNARLEEIARELGITREEVIKRALASIK